MQKFELSAKELGVTVSLDIQQDMPWVQADVALIERVLDNLIENALRHSPRGGGVAITMTVQGDQVRLEVTDSGPGLTPDQVSRVFDRFYRSDPGRSADTGHAGLGLAIVKNILELHGATIAVDGRPGLGACFYFKLPIALSAQRAGAKAASGIG